MYLNRDIEKTIKDAAKDFKVITIYGGRQIGKSTTVKYLFNKGFDWVTLDNAEDLAQALDNPRDFLEKHKWPVIIDEIQKAPVLLSYIKMIVDEKKYEWLMNNKKGQLMYVLTGSNQYELQHGISESLAGRTAIIDMSSLTRFETINEPGKAFIPKVEELIERSKKRKIKYSSSSDIFKTIFTGFMPEVVTKQEERTRFYESYINTYIEKDVRQLISATSELPFRKFLKLVALRTSQTIVYDKLANDVGISVHTCKQWLSILETSGIIYFLEPYMSNISKRIIKTPKVYFMDTGLCAYLCGWTDSNILENCAMSGAFLETYVVSEIIKGYLNEGKNPKYFIYYYRDIDDREIDILYLEADGITPIEIKKNTSPSNPTKNFKALEKYKMPIKTGLVIDFTDGIRKINDSAYSFPIYLLGI